MQPIDRLKLWDHSAAQTDAGLLCEGPRLALLSSQMFSMHCPSLQRTLGASGEQARSHTHMKANGSELGSCKSWSCQARRQGLCHGPKLPDNKQGSLGIASQPATGRDVELRDSNSARDEPHAKFRREFCCQGQCAMVLWQMVTFTFVERGAAESAIAFVAGLTTQWQASRLRLAGFPAVLAAHEHATQPNNQPTEPSMRTFQERAMVHATTSKSEQGKERRRATGSQRQLSG
jgi:hypothetical protein